jgi:Mor family transcriptional regulator
MRAVDPLAGRRPRRQLDHAQVYQMLDAGKDRKEISKLLDFPTENIDYVIKKWRAGLPLYEKFQKPRIDAKALMKDFRGGATPKQLADQYNTALAYVYKLIKIQKDLECLDPNQL